MRPVSKYPNALAFCAPSGTGKTTFLCELIKKILLEENRYRAQDIVVLKMSHHPIQERSQGKDCQKYRDLGIVALATNQIEEAQAFLKKHQHRICLVEGGRRLNLPSLVLRRTEISHIGWKRPQRILMVVDL